MCKNLFKSLIFTVLTGCAGFTYAAPASMSGDASSSQVQSAAETKPNGKIDLNGADAVTLQRELAGIGEAKAKAIVAYRVSNGPFASVDELLEVKGIGKAILDRNREKLEAK